MTHPFNAPIRRYWLSDIAELVAIALFIAGLAVSLAGMQQTNMAAQAYQIGGESQ